MPIEFLGMGATNDGSETTPRSGGSFDPAYTIALARAHEEHGWDRVLTAYGSGSPDPAQAAATIAAHTETLQVLVAHRPNLSIPTFAAKTFATLDHASGGRVAVHVITGGSDHEQQREGDFLTKDERYGRTGEYIQVLKRAWTEHEPFDFDGEHYRFADFVSDVFPVQEPRPTISFGGSSDAAYAIGTAEADVFCLWGEPLADTAEQVARVRAEAAASGRGDQPRIQVAFRPIIAPTADEAWDKAHRVVSRIEDRKAGGQRYRRGGGDAPENTGSQRLLEIADRGDVHDTILYSGTAKATAGAGNSNALVGTPQQVADALLAYVDLGIDVLSARGYDTLQDAIDFGDEVIPIVREGVASRDARAGA
ncbi:MAG: LLM class flavin-dependent oxidoreductase [Nocardioidaceae bacterium]|nr:LLM class flavin-dependent oxidoreductase [Nocardioidaceae bacterium]